MMSNPLELTVLAFPILVALHTYLWCHISGDSQ